MIASRAEAISGERKHLTARMSEMHKEKTTSLVYYFYGKVIKVLLLVLHSINWSFHSQTHLIEQFDPRDEEIQFAEFLNDLIARMRRRQGSD